MLTRKQCARVDCRRDFWPTNPRQEYCHPRCGNTVRIRRWRAARRPSCPHCGLGLPSTAIQAVAEAWYGGA